MKNIQEKIAETDWEKEVDIYSLFDKDKDSVHSAELAEALDKMPLESAATSFYQFPEEIQVDVFSYLDDYLQQQFVLKLPKRNTISLLNALRSDDRTSFLEHLSLDQRSRYISLLTPEIKASTLGFLSFPEDTVARIVNIDFATIPANVTVGEASSYLRANNEDSEATNVVYIIDDEGLLLDDIQIRRLVLNTPETKIKDLMDGDFVYLYLDESIQSAVDKFMDYDRIVIPVVNNHMKLIGVVTIDDIMDISEELETKSMQKFGGMEELDFPYVKTSLWRLTEKRAVWLTILFVGEMLTATAMGFFEAEIEKAVVLALFVPLVISSGGNSGSQAATLIIRALSLKEINLRDWWFVMRREFLSGFLLGTTLGAIGLLRITIWQTLGWYDYGEHWLLIGLTICVSLIGIVLWGTISGALIPLILKRLKMDPATSSAPFVATLVDVTGIIIYFTVAAIFLSGTLL